MHHNHYFKERFPLKYSFQKLRARARERGHEFSLTYEQYEAFAIKTDYARLKGKTSLSLSIDRKDDSLGYHHWNIQAITIRENSRKLWTDMPGYMKEEMRLAMEGHIPQSHREL
jgi:hypothetical protein